MNKKLIILLCCGLAGPVVTPAQQITFYRDIAPILQQHCVTCHRPGGAGPFPLITYEDAAKRARFIRQVINSGYMPPWKADTSYRHFCNERALSRQEISLINRWIDRQAPAGKKNFEAADILKNYTEGTQYGRKADLTLKMDHPYLIKGDNKERFVYVKLPYEMQDSANVEAVEFICDNKKIIHHANYAFYDTVAGVNIYEGSGIAVMNQYAPEDPAQLKQFDPYVRGNRMIHYGGYIPGSSYEAFPENMGFVMPRKGVIVLTLHLSPSALDTSFIAGVHLFFKKTPVRRKTEIVSIGSGGLGTIKPALILLPGRVDSFEAKAIAGKDQSLLYVWPHMHLLGKSFSAYAVTPAGDTIHLVRVPHWDFNWQQLYKFRHLVHIPKGSLIVVKGVYDNTADNPRNPNNPPKMVFSDEKDVMRTTDEMLTLIMIYVPYEPGDEKIALCNDK